VIQPDGAGDSLLLFWLIGSAGVSAALTGVTRRIAVARAILDLPNERSLHQQPIPRAGGVSIAGTVTGALLFLGWGGLLAGDEVLGLLGAALLVAVVGWIDDLRSLPTRLRASVHALAGIWFLAWTGGFHAIRIGDETIQLGLAGDGLALVGIVWSVNLYNFMDGVDGIAGGQGVIAAGLGALLLVPAQPGLGLLAAALSGACLGFLVWNWSPARIFMGDVGSGLLGFLFAALALLSERNGGPTLLVWAFFGGVFIFDATVTLLRRAMRGERWWAAHRSHAYQRAVQSGWGHARVASGIIGLAAAMGALGIVVARIPELLPWCAGAALVVLIAFYLAIERRFPMARSRDSS
jgi:Fuc2NAc and GlcNAc transferase